MANVTYGTGTEDDPWTLQTPPQSSEFEAWIDGDVLHVAVGKTRLSYQARALEDCAAMLRDHGDWMALGNADEGKSAKDGSVEAWARSEDNPVGGYYGRRKGYRGRFANYVTPVMEMMGTVELDHAKRGGQVRATLL